MILGVDGVLLCSLEISCDLYTQIKQAQDLDGELRSKKHQIDFSVASYETIV